MTAAHLWIWRALKPTGTARRWWILAILAIAQLMIVVDASIVNIALPERPARPAHHHRRPAVGDHGLHADLRRPAARSAAGSPTTSVANGSASSACSASPAASALGGLAPDASLLFAARALQGAFAALMAPAALSLLTVTFTEARERARAFGVWGAIAGGGLAIGLILGGVLTQYASWRWCLLVNTPIALLAAFAAFRLIPESRVGRPHPLRHPGRRSRRPSAWSPSCTASPRRRPTGGRRRRRSACSAVAVALLVAFVVIERVQRPSPAARCGS